MRELVTEAPAYREGEKVRVAHGKSAHRGRIGVVHMVSAVLRGEKRLYWVTFDPIDMDEILQPVVGAFLDRELEKA